MSQAVLPAQNAPSPIRPRFESWQVGLSTFSSTQELVDGFRPDPKGEPAFYRFSTTPELTPGERLLNTAATGVLGAAVGAGVAIVGVGALQALGLIGTILTGGFFGTSAAVALGGPVAAGAAVGATLGLMAGREETAPESRTVAGTLKSEPRSDGEHLFFYPGGRVEGAIDLKEYARAPQISPAPPVPPEPAWKDALRGAGAGLALVGGSMVPVLGLIAPAAAGSEIGRAAAGGRSYGTIFGAAAGAAVTAATYAAVSGLGLPGLALALGSGALGGALLGPALAPRVRQHRADEAVYADQWWNRRYEPEG